MNKELIDFFEKNPGVYLSGEQLSERLRCSRTAVWKQIQRLKTVGYRFESAPRRGYRLLDKPDQLSASAIIGGCDGLSVFTGLRLLEAVDSTQSEAHRLADKGGDHGTLVIAESQSAGRGRQGRLWYSPAGKGIWMSLLIRPPISLIFAPQMTLLTAVALSRTIRKTLDAQVGIKWPNDLLIRGKKISGILVESVGEDERVRYMAVGVGIDCNMDERDYPEELHAKATSLQIETGQRVDRSALIAAFMREFDELYRMYLAHGFAPIRTLWESLSVSLGNPISLTVGGRTLEGIAEAMDELGALVLRKADGSAERIFSGETEA